MSTYTYPHHGHHQYNTPDKVRIVLGGVPSVNRHHVQEPQFRLTLQALNDLQWISQALQWLVASGWYVFSCGVKLVQAGFSAMGRSSPCLSCGLLPSIVCTGRVRSVQRV